MATLLTSLKWLFYCGLALATAMGLCWWLIPDEALNPEAASFVAQPTVPPSAKNASFMLWGLPASPELDAYTVGRRIVSAWDRLEAAQKDSSVFRDDEYLGANPLNFGDTKYLCDAERENCLLVYQKSPERVEKELSSRSVYLERYRKIRTYEEFVSANSKITLATGVPNWGAAIRMSELSSASVALDMRSIAKQRSALTELAADIGTWKKILTTHDWVLGQTLAVIALHRKYRLASEILNAYPEVLERFPDLVQTITAPIPLADAKMVVGLKTEARIRMQHLWDLGGEGRLGTQWLYADSRVGFLKQLALHFAYQPQATINEAYALARMSIDHYDQPPKEFLASDTAFMQRLAEIRQFRPLDFFYNPAGRLDVGEGLDMDYRKYYFRLHDLVGLSRMVALQRQLIAARVPSSKVAELLTSFGPELLDPFTERPMQWNAQSRQLSFELHGKRFANFGFVDVAMEK
jgi:hypothetical protein